MFIAIHLFFNLFINILLLLKSGYKVKPFDHYPGSPFGDPLDSVEDKPMEQSPQNTLNNNSNIYLNSSNTLENQSKKSYKQSTLVY